MLIEREPWPRQRIIVPKIEFYITNVCNLSCDQCNRFNDHKFTGFQRWSDYEAEYEQWGNYIKPRQVVLLGGEPLLNPTVLDWVRGINRIFGNTVQILTNGTRLNHVPGLYKILETKLPLENWLGISWHHHDTLDVLERDLEKFMTGTVRRLERDDPLNIHGGHFIYVDDKDVRIPVWIQDHFDQAAIFRENGVFRLHDSDPDTAHKNCVFVHWGSYHFIRAKLYKCGPVALFDEFDQQHHLNVPDEDRHLLTSYRPLSVDEFEQRGEEFLNNIDNVIPQCKFCPEHPENRKIVSVLKNKK